MLISVVIFAFFYITSSIFARILVIILNTIKSPKDAKTEFKKTKQKINLVKSKTEKKKILKKEELKLSDYPIFKPARYFFIILGIYLAIYNLSLPTNIFEIVTKIYRVSCIWIIAVAIANSITPNSQIFLKLNNNVKYTKKDKATSLIFKVIRAVIYIVASVIIISELGYNINGLIAGLGLGGVTFALAAQDTAKNLFGGIILIFDKPFIVGDWIETSSVEGIVEDITFRSTRIKTFKDSIATVPNSTIANDVITNWSRMSKRKVVINLVATFSTSLKELCDVSNKIEEMLIEHKDVLNDSISVAFDEIVDNGQNIRVGFFISQTNYFEYLKVKENINYKIMQILESEKVELAYDTKTVYIEKSKS